MLVQTLVITIQLTCLWITLTRQEFASSPRIYLLVRSNFSCLQLQVITHQQLLTFIYKHVSKILVKSFSKRNCLFYEFGLLAGLGSQGLDWQCRSKFTYNKMMMKWWEKVVAFVGSSECEELITLIFGSAYFQSFLFSIGRFRFRSWFTNMYYNLAEEVGSREHWLWDIARKKN